MLLNKDLQHDDDLNAHEGFLGFYQIRNIESNTISSALQDILVRAQLSLNNCRGQCYDGASNMLGRKSGVAQQIQSMQPKALPTHCHAHSLSLGIKDTVNQCELLSTTMGTAKEIITLTKYSPKRENILGEVKENIENGDEEDVDKCREGGLLKLCPTRWTVRASCYERIIENYAFLFKAWKLCLSKKLEFDIKARILGCEYQMKSFDFFYGLHLSLRIFSHTDNLSKSLQSSSLSAASSQYLVKLTLSTLESIRSETSFNAFFETILKKKLEHPEVSQPGLIRKRHAPIRFEVGDAAPEYPNTEQDRYRRLYY